MTLTRSRTLQYVVIILVLAAIAVGGYWFYLRTKAATRLQNAPDGVVTNGLLGYWTFDGADISGTTVTDRSGAGNNGTIGGTTKVSGIVGQALDFGYNNNTSYVNVGSAAGIDDNAQKSICAWMYPKSYGDSGNDMTILEKAPAASNFGWNFGLMDDDGGVTSLYFHQIFSSASGGWRAGLDVVTLNAWQHVCMTYDRSSTANNPIFYVNGTPVAVTRFQAPSGTATSDSSYNLYIGNITAGSFTSSFDGRLDEVRYYNRIITAAEVLELYRSASGATAAVSAGGDTASYDASLVGYWKLDEGTGASASDMSGWGNTGTLTNSPTWATGKFSGGVTFDGTDDYIDIGDPSSGVLDLSSVAAPFGITGWFNRSTYTTDDTIVAKKNDQATNAGYIIYIDDADDKIHALLSDGTGVCSVTSAETFTASGWHQFVLSFDNSYNTSGNCGFYSLYVDGVWSANGNNGTYTYGAYSNALSFRIGAESDGGNPFAGSLDDIRVYGRRIDMNSGAGDLCAECLRMYLATKGINEPANDTSIVGWWPFDGTTLFGATAADMARSPHKGTLANGPASTLGRIGQALLFDGTDDQITITHNTALDPDDLTLTLWMRRDGTQNANAQVLGKPWSSSGNNNWSYALEFYSDGKKLQWEMNDSNLTIPMVVTQNDIPDNAWVFVTGTYTNSSKTLELFINGVSQGTYVLPGSRVKYTGDIGIGRYIGGGGEFKGALDDIRLYNRVLSSAEIYQLSQSGTTNVGGTTEDPLKQSLVGYWALDNGSGTSASDGSGNGNNGTLTSGPTWGTGMVGGAVDFDGTDDYVTLGTPATLNLPGAMTACAWVYAHSVPNTYDSRIIANTHSDGTTQQYSFEIENNRSIALYWKGSGTGSLISGAGAIAFNGWYHLCAVRASSSAGVIYVNGAAQTTTVTSSSIVTVGYGNTAIGRAGSYSGSYFDGRLDEVRLYSRALSGEEVRKLYQQTSPAGGIDSSLVGHWTFDGPDIASNDTVIDRSGKGNYGTLTNGPVPALGRIGQALSFDGTDDFTDVSSNATIDNQSKFTFCAWAYATGWGGGNEGTLAFKGYTIGKWYIWLDNAGSEASFASLVETSLTNAVSKAPLGAFTLNEWVHLCSSYDDSGDRKIRLYKNGSEVSSYRTQTAAGGTLQSESGEGLVIGSGGIAPAWLFQGKLDDVRLYNRVLSASEIGALYNMGK